MNYTTTLHGVTFDIEYHVDSEGDFDQFDIEVSGQLVTDVLSEKVVKELEQVTWDQGFIPDCKSHNDDLRIERYLSSLETT